MKRIIIALFAVALIGVPLASTQAQIVVPKAGDAGTKRVLIAVSTWVPGRTTSVMYRKLYPTISLMWLVT